MSQTQNDGTQHPVAYTSRAVSPTEWDYTITDLETLAVVSHFHHYVYGHRVTVLTDQLAVKAIRLTVVLVTIYTCNSSAD